MTLKKILKLALVALTSATLMTGCTQADTVRYNITQEADSFNVTRRITVFNTRTDKVLMQMTGVSERVYNQLSVGDTVEVSKKVTYLFGTYLGTDYKLKN